MRRVDIGVYEIRFVGDRAPSAIGSGVGAFTATTESLGAGTFRVRVQDVGRASAADGPFMVTAVLDAQGKRGETTAAMPAASRRSTPPIARKSHVISLSPGSRPSREPRFS